MTVHYFMSNDASCANDTYVTARLSDSKRVQQVVQLYQLVHITAKRGHWTGKSNHCTITGCPICYIAMKSMDLFGLKRMDNRQVVKLSQDGTYLACKS